MVERGVGPFLGCSLDEAFRVAVRARRVNAGAGVLKPEAAMGVGTGRRRSKICCRSSRPAAGCGGERSRHGPGAGSSWPRRLFNPAAHRRIHAEVVVDGDLNELSTGAARLFLCAAGRRFFEPRQIRDIDMQLIARMVPS